MALRAASVASWVLAWQVASLVVGSDLLLPGPLGTLASLGGVVTSPRFAGILGFSTLRIALGFLLGFLAAVALGMLVHASPVARGLVMPAVSTLKSVPIACVIVLLLIWVGAASVSGIVVFVAVFPPVLFSVIEGLDNVDARQDDALRRFEVSGPRRFLALSWPQTLPYVLAASRNACGMAWKAGVAAEVVGTPVGSMGERIYQAKLLLETGDVFAWTIVIIVAAFACERAFLAVLAATGRVSVRLSVLGLGGGDGTSGATSSAPGREPGEVVLDDVAFGHGAKVVCSRVSLTVRPGERVILQDVSGAGKTTLLATLLGELAPMGGRVGVPSHVSAMWQDVRLVEGLDAVGNVLLATCASLSRDEVRDLLLELLPSEALCVPVSQLSGGQRRRVEIVRAMAFPSQAVLLDEPFASLDERSHEAAARFVLSRLGGRPLIVASHLRDDGALLGATPFWLHGRK